MKDFLEEGSKWSLVNLSKEERQKEFKDALAFGNHKGASQKPELLKKLIGKDVKYGYSLPIPLASVRSISGICMAPMNIMAQNTINELGRIIPKDRLTHDQSWKWLSGTSVNSCIKKELLQACRYGFCIWRLINWTLAARQHYTNQRILASKIDYKPAYHRGDLNFAMALQTAMQLPDNDLAIITLWLTFGGAPCPFEWGIMSKTICNLANELLKCKEWDQRTLHATVQADIPARKYLCNDVPFAIGRELIIDIPINPHGYADVYINNTTGLTIDLPGTHNADRLEAAIPLAIEVAAQPNNVNKPIPREPMVAQDKLKAEGGLAETKVILGWHFNFRTLTVTLPEHKHIAWSGEIRAMNNKESTGIDNRKTGPCRLHHPMGFPFPELPPITVGARSK
jgi:hypothetical protein